MCSLVYTVATCLFICAMEHLDNSENSYYLEPKQCFRTGTALTKHWAKLMSGLDRSQSATQASCSQRLQPAVSFRSSTGDCPSSSAVHKDWIRWKENCVPLNSTTKKKRDHWLGLKYSIHAFFKHWPSVKHTWRNTHAVHREGHSQLYLHQTYSTVSLNVCSTLWQRQWRTGLADLQTSGPSLTNLKAYIRPNLKINK